MPKRKTDVAEVMDEATVEVMDDPFVAEEDEVEVETPTLRMTAKRQVSDPFPLLWSELPTKQRVIGRDDKGNAVMGEYIELPNLIRRLQSIVGLGYSIHFEPPNILQTKEGYFVSVKAYVSIQFDDGTSAFEGIGTGTANSLSRLETAVKGAETDAVKRALRYTGLGLWLYEKGVSVQSGGGGYTNRNGNRNGKGNRNRNADFSDDVLENMETFSHLFGVDPDDIPLSPKQKGVIFSNRNFKRLREFVDAEGSDVVYDKEAMSDFISTLLNK